jgi:hypothetical protein
MNSHRTVWSQVAYDRTNNRKQNGVNPCSLSHGKHTEKAIKTFLLQNSWVKPGQEYNAFAAYRLKRAASEFKKSDALVRKRIKSHSVRWQGRRERTNTGILVVGKFM